MPLKWFICPDNARIEVKDCLKEGGCRMTGRCASRSYLRLVSKEREWTGKPSTTQLIQGTMCAFLKLTQDFAISPDSRAFMIHGTKGHANLEAADDEYSILEQKFDGDDVDITGIADDLEIENEVSVLLDYKTSGSFKVAKALGFYVAEEETEEVFKSGPRKGQPKMRKVLKRDDCKIDRWEWELQINKYRIEFEKLGFKVDRLRIQCCVRDGNTYIAKSRGVFRNIYYFDIPILNNEFVLSYFDKKKKALFQALEQGYWKKPCTPQENWDGLKCAKYCEVAEYCSLGKYLKKEKEVDNMAIKNLSDVRRLPRLGKIRLGIKKVKDGKEYPAEVDYFILDPQIASELENKKLVEEFNRLYGDKPKQIKIMLPLGNLDDIFPQFYKRYGKTTLLQCKGDGETAVCSSEEFIEGLEVIGKSEMGLPKVKCLGPDCPYQQNKQCAKVGTLQVMLPELPGAGVWQITTGSFNSIVNVNSCLDYVRAVAGRFHMLPLVLERREQAIQHDGKARKHYVLHIDLPSGVSLLDLQKFANIDPSKILIELPDVEDEKADLMFQENVVEEAKEVKELPAQQEVKEKEVKETQEKIDADAIKKIEEIAEARGWKNGELKNYCLATYGKESLQDLSIAEGRKLYLYIKNVGVE